MSKEVDCACKKCNFFYDANNYKEADCDGSMNFCCYFPKMVLLSENRPVCNFYSEKIDVNNNLKMPPNRSVKSFGI